MRNIAIIPARSGSKGLKDKNIKLLNGKPLLAYSIDVALKSEMFEKVFVSTDSEKYADIARKCGASVDFLRSGKNSTDSAGTWDAVREVIGILEKNGEYYERIMLLQPTSPLRSKEDVLRSFELFLDKKADSVVSVTEMDHSPLWCNTLPSDLSMEGFQRPEYFGVPRQQLPKYYRINGALYLIKRECLDDKGLLKENTYAYIMPRERSIDIDTELDFIIAEAIMDRGQIGE